jgi:hypothetical protein
MHLLAVVLLIAPLTPAPMPVTDILRAWDAARTTAYADADAAALKALYAPGSRAGAADAAILRDYRARGISVWQRQQVFAARVRERSATTFTLRVTDRTMTVIGDGVHCRALPTTQPSTRDVAFVLRSGRWLVEWVRPVRPAAPR